MGWSRGTLLGFDLETTGVDPMADLPVQVALVTVDTEGRGERTVFLVDPGRDVPEAARAVHGISSEQVREEGRTLGDAARVIHGVLSGAQEALVPVVVMNASYDITIASRLFAAFGLSPVEWQALVDPLVIDRKVDRFRSGKRRLDALCATYGVALGSAHDAGHDADATIALARALAARYPELDRYGIKELTRLEQDWHRDWATEFDRWRRSKGQPGLAPGELCWPVRAPEGADLPPS